MLTDIGDHLHEIAHADSGKLEPVTHFSYSEVDRRLGFEDEEDMVSFSDASASVALILQWVCGRVDSGKRHVPSIVSAGAKANALLWMIDPINARYKSLADIANAAGITRASASKSLLELRDQLGEIFPLRSMWARDNCRKAQHAAHRAGVHSSQRKRQKQLAEISE